MFAQITKGSLVQRELARERLRDCKSLEFAGKKKKKIVLCQAQPLRRAPCGTSPYTGEAWKCAAGAKKSPSRRMGFGLPGAPAQKKKKQKENAVKETRKRGLFEKSPLLTPLKTFGQPSPGCWVCAPKVTRQPTGRTARCPPHVMRFTAFSAPFAQEVPSDPAPGGSRRHRTSGNG